MICKRDNSNFIPVILPFLGLLKDWWEKSTAEKYVERAQCIVDQYGNFTSKQVGMPINGVNSLGENIADHGGIKESYGAYRENLSNYKTWWIH